MRQLEKYATSNIELLIEIMQNIGSEKYNPVTICTLKNILKGRAKRGDVDALQKYIKYSSFRIFMTSKQTRLTQEEIEQTIIGIYNEYISESDPKKQDLNTAFEDFENEYYY